ncbi:MAG TPA: hypothetical protein PLR85_18790 [Nitrospira sp.]|nr:hypothetical protein [Rhodocyclaceae bacterium]HMZ84452.1 hypothetical protein [Rhodocyclaceae bacterium]HNG55439.1 hypothetical protein [Nitrospira sp.]
MSTTARRILIAGLIVVISITAYGYYVRSLRAENDRLIAVVQAKFVDISIPSGSDLVYQEFEASRVCKTAEIRKLFSTQDAPEKICDSILLPLKSAGWESHLGCRVAAYPYKRAPIDGNRPSYSSSVFAAGVPSKQFGASLKAQPHDAWGPLFMLSSFGEQEAIPIARRMGKTFFTVEIRYTEDQALFGRHCPENGPRCDCVNSTLFAWNFSDGREYSRSE